MAYFRYLVGAVVVAAVAATAGSAESFRVSSVLEAEVPLPGGQPGETIRAFGPPALDGTDLAFAASTSTGFVGVYLLTPEEGLVEIVRTGSRPPGQPDGTIFSTVDLGLTLDARRVGFFGEWFVPDKGGGAGLYLWENGALRTVADSTGPALPGIGVASNFWPAFAADGTCLFRAGGFGGAGLFREDSPGAFASILLVGDQAPWDDPGATVGAVGSVFSNREGLTFVGGAGGSAQLIRRGTDGTWAALTDHLETPTPGIPGAYLFVEDILSGPPSLIGDDVAFRSRSYIPPGPLLLPGAGIYRSRGGSLEVVADGSTLHPVSGLPFNPQFFPYHPSGGARHLSFRGGTADALFGIHVVNDDGEWTVLAEQGSLFAGLPVVSFGHGHQAWDGERLAITVIHPAGSTIYVVDFGQPSVLEVPTLGARSLALLVAALAMAGFVAIRSSA